MTTASDFPRRPTSGRILVGYVATAAGRDALNLAIALARGRDVSLEIVMVAPLHNTFSGVYPHDRGYGSIMEEQIANWLQEALDQVPDDIPAVARIVRGESEAEALSDAAGELDCDLIVVGARAGGVLGRFQIGAVANTLLHSSSVPVALAPRGYEHPGPITRVTSMFGPRPGTSDVVAIGFDRARRREIPLRLISLVIRGEAADRNPEGDVVTAIARYGNQRLGEIASDMVAAGHATTEVSAGKTVETAMEDLDWEDGEVAIVGSSRMASQGRLFIGGTASRMLRSIPAPMVVVPHGYMRTEEGETDE